jgi:hypothetical protein
MIFMSACLCPLPFHHSANALSPSCILSLPALFHVHFSLHWLHMSMLLGSLTKTQAKTVLSHLAITVSYMLQLREYSLYNANEATLHFSGKAQKRKGGRRVSLCCFSKERHTLTRLYHPPLCSSFSSHNSMKQDHNVQ